MQAQLRGSRFVRLVAGLLLAGFCCLACASEIELTAESVAVNDDSTVTSYIGDVVLRVPASTHIEFKSKTTRQEQGAKVLEGDVEILVEDLVIRTQKATLTSQGDVLVKMDAAEASVLKKR
jgi:lipopolysaccharide export system protein LptA